MNFYSFDEIRQAGDCVRFVQEILGLQVVDGRCRAAWRGGDNDTAVSLEKEVWHDFRDETGGNLLTLCALTKFGGNTAKTRQQAQEFLGEWLHLEPKKQSRERNHLGRYQQLVRDGYKDIRHYNYVDENGNHIHTTIRLEKPGAKKEFVQCTPTSASLKGIDTYLYNLPAVLASDTVYLAEGEKDAETLISWGLCGTTAPCGANKWEERYTEWLAGRHVVIVRDKDDAGFAHAVIVGKAIFGKVASVKIACPWLVAKDVTEWAEIEHGDAAKFLALVADIPEIKSLDEIRDENAAAVLRAKELNHEPFRNYIERKVEVDDTVKTERIPRLTEDMLKELFDRFLGYPRRLGSSLFDFDRDTDKINHLEKPEKFQAWIGIKSNNLIDFSGHVAGGISMKVFYEAVLQRAVAYDSIALAPTWPRRKNVFYGFREKVKPTKDHQIFEEFIKFFSPASPQYEILLRVFFAAPLYYEDGIPRPIWLIDSNSGAGVGKTTLVEILAQLYHCSPIRTSPNRMKQNFNELVCGELLSPGGRTSRIFLIDNLVGKFNSPEFADITTSREISGRAKYAHGTEFRANDLTYCITANNAEVSDDIASRSFTIMLSRPQTPMIMWKSSVMEFVELHRYEILGDIIDILQQGANYSRDSQTRYPEFEHKICMPMCGTAERFDAMMEVMMAQRNTSNVDYENARQIDECVKIGLAASNIDNVEDGVIFIRAEAYNFWLKQDGLSCSTSDIRGYIRSGKMAAYVNDFFVFPQNNSREGWYGLPRATGVLRVGRNVTTKTYAGILVVGRTGQGEYGAVNAATVARSQRDEQVIAEIRRREEIIATVVPAPAEIEQPAPAQAVAPAPAQITDDDELFDIDVDDYPTYPY